MQKHILVITQYFYPEQFRINDMCTEWVKKGYEVTVITGIPNYPDGKFYDGFNLMKKRKELYNGVNVVRLPIIPRGNNSIMLALNYFSFVISGFFWHLFTKIKADNVFIFEVSPMTQALPGVWYAKKNKIPCYIYVQDLWPENLEIVAGIKNPTILNQVGKMVDYIYRNCQTIFTTSESFVEAIVERGVNRKKVKYWPQYAEDFYKPVKSLKVESDKMDIIFTGNIGEAQGLDILVDAAITLRDEFKNEKVTYTIIGNGRYKETLLKKVRENNLSHLFNFIDKQPATAIPSYLSNSDVAFLSLNNDPLFSKTIPAKLQSYMACGKPVLASADGETEKIINEANCGISSKSGDSKELVLAILELYKKTNRELEIYGENARSYYLENFEKNKLLSKMDKFFVAHSGGAIDVY